MSAQDVTFVAITIFVVAISFFSFAYFGGAFISKFQENPVINETSGAVTVLAKTDGMLNRLDYGILILFLGLSLALIITGWMVGGEPIFAIVYLFVIFFSILFSAFFSNFWESFTSVSAWGTTLLSFPITNHILLFFPMYIAIVGVIGMTVMFAKPFIRGGNDYV